MAMLTAETQEGLSGKPCARKRARTVWGEGRGNTPVVTLEGAPRSYSTTMGWYGFRQGRQTRGVGRKCA
jgi:hypothetical protein